MAQRPMLSNKRIEGLGKSTTLPASLDGQHRVKLLGMVTKTQSNTPLESACPEALSVDMHCKTKEGMCKLGYKHGPQDALQTSSEATWARIRHSHTRQKGERRLARRSSALSLST